MPLCQGYCVMKVKEYHPGGSRRSGVIRIIAFSEDPDMIKRSSYFSPFRKKCLLDSMTRIRYMNPNLWLPNDECRFFRFHYASGCIRLPHPSLSFHPLRSKKGNSFQPRPRRLKALSFTIYTWRGHRFRPCVQPGPEAWLNPSEKTAPTTPCI